MAKKNVAQNKNTNKKKEKVGLLEYIRGVKLEMKKVVWPTQKGLYSSAALVVVACTFFAVAFWAIDTGFLALLRRMLGINM